MKDKDQNIQQTKRHSGEAELTKGTEKKIKNQTKHKSSLYLQKDEKTLCPQNRMLIKEQSENKKRPLEIKYMIAKIKNKNQWMSWKMN